MFFLISLYTLVVLFASCLQPIDGEGVSLERITKLTPVAVQLLAQQSDR